MHDPALRQLMHRIRIGENPEFTRQFPSRMVTEIEVQTRGGQRVVETASYPKGHAMNPMSDAEVESKFAGLSENLLTSGRRDSIIRALWEVDQAADIGKVIKLVRVDK
jgi:2-methylcitrate dehydratase